MLVYDQRGKTEKKAFEAEYSSVEKATQRKSHKRGNQTCHSLVEANALTIATGLIPKILSIH